MTGTLSRLPREVLLEPDLADGQSVKIIGLGGVGGIVARYGAMWLASLCTDCDARLVLIDGDSFERQNAARMLFRQPGNKATLVRDDLLEYLSDSHLTLVAVEEYVTPENVDRLISNRDIVIACVDNHATRKLLNDHCAQLNEAVLISGGNDGVGPDSTGKIRRGTFGNCQIYIRREGRDASPPITRSHPEIAAPLDRTPADQSCTELLNSVPQIALANLTAAASILNTLWLHLCGALHYHELAFDIAEAVMRPLHSKGPPT